MTGQHRKRAVRALPLIVALTAAALSAAAQGSFCSEPVTPVCANGSEPLQSDRRQTCLDDLKRYEEDQTDYLACIETQLETAKEKLGAIEALRRCIEDKGGEACGGS